MFQDFITDLRANMLLNYLREKGYNQDLSDEAIREIATKLFECESYEEGLKVLKELQKKYPFLKGIDEKISETDRKAFTAMTRKNHPDYFEKADRIHVFEAKDGKIYRR